MIIKKVNSKLRISEGFIWIILIIILFTIFISFLLYYQSINERFIDNGTIIDKWVKDDIIYCLIDIHDTRYKTRIGCESKIIGDYVKVVMNRNIDTFEINLVGILK